MSEHAGFVCNCGGFVPAGTSHTCAVRLPTSVTTERPAFVIYDPLSTVLAPSNPHSSCGIAAEREVTRLRAENERLRTKLATSEKNIESAAEECLCEECGRDYEVWFAPNDIWNRVMRKEDHETSGPEPFLCAACFMRRAAADIATTGWLVTPDPEPRVVLHFASQLTARAEPHPDPDFAKTMARFVAEALDKKIADCAAELNRSIFEQTGCGLNALALIQVLPILRKYFGTEGSK